MLFLQKYLDFLQKLKDLPLLALRLVLAYGFYQPAMKKLADIEAIGEWFATLGIPFSLFQAYLATYTETAGVILLTLGLGTRFIAVPLIVTMLVAIQTVHFANGFEASNNGYEIPLYYLLMLFTLLVYGSGKLGLDYFLLKNNKK